MKIDHIETIHMYFEYEPGTSFSTPMGPVKGRLATLIRVHTDDGRCGIGSAYAHPSMVQAAIDHLSPLLVGQELLDDQPNQLDQFLDTSDRIEAIWRIMYLWTRWSGRKGAAVVALGGIDQALWDLRGQALNKPVWELLGGERSNCPAYASGIMYDAPESAANFAVRMVDKGYQRVKVRVGYNWDHDVAAIREARKAVGDSIDIMADGTQRFDMHSARLMARELVAQKVFWFEEPFEPQDIDQCAALRGTMGLPMAMGENEFGFEGFRELIRVGAADILQADASRCGGISEVMKVAKLAKSAGLRIAPHSWCDPVAVISNAHAVAACSNGITVEIDQTGNQYIEELFGSPLSVKDGMLELGNKPGLGIELDEDFVKAHRLDDPYNLPEGNHCDILIGPPSVMEPIGPYIGPDG